jgi:type IV pilus assembly protein PilQ
MNRAKRILVIAGVVVLSVNGASASWFRHKPAEKAPQAAAAPEAGIMLSAIEIESTPPARLLLRTTGTPVYTSYSPAPTRFVVDLTSTAKAPSLAIPPALPPQVTSISAEEVTEMGTRLTRVTVNLTVPSTPQAVAADNLVTISFPAAVADIHDEALPAVVPVIPPSTQASAASPPVVPEPEPVRVSEPVVTSEPIRIETPRRETPKSQPLAVAKSGARLPKAKVLKSVSTTKENGSTEVLLAGDGEIAYNAFKLEGPSRVVLDLSGVHNKLAKNAIITGDPTVTRIRVSQFAPDVTRVVLDLSQTTEYHVAADHNRLRVTFGANAAVAANSEPAPIVVEPPPAAAVQPAPEPVKVAEAPKPAPVIEAPRAEAPKPAPVVETAKVTPIAEAPKPAPAKRETKSAAANSSDPTEQVPTTVPEKMPTWKMPATRVVITAPSGQTSPPSGTARKSSKGKKGSTATPAPASGENVFSEPTQSTPVLGTNTPPGGMTGRLASATPQQRGNTLSSGEKVYTGEPIDLNLKDADIRDVLRTFANLTGLNIAVDPGVAGAVTVDFNGVPWDQALDIILRQNNLTYTLDGNVMRVGYIARLAEEQRQQAFLLEQEKLNVSLTTVSRKLSYARANDVATLLGAIASPKAKVIVDARTNQLIISEIPGYLLTMQNLIDSVDVPTRQVLIEARIVETSKTFLQQYGFTWGFGGKLDPSLGTGTGLVFPNRLDFTGGPFEFGPGNPIIATHMSNILGTFTLDLALNAAEAEGLIKVISAPRVMTQDNVPASITSGFQIPYQTRINFTTTISYLDAALSLIVTPQITESGTVIMEIAVAKLEPAAGLAIQGSAGTPLSSRSARTRLMVRDGGTSVIAGIYQTKENDGRTRLPFVHQIPIIGALFRTHNITTSHDELLIFITPRIVRNI